MAPYYNEGKHPATIVGQGFDDGKYGVQFILTIELDDNTGNTRTVYLSLTDENGQRAKFADKTIEVLRHLGFAGSEASLARLDPDHANHFSFVGDPCEGYCVHKSTDAGTKERWYINTPRAGMERTPPEKTALRKLDSLFGKELKEPLAEGETPKSVRPVDDPPDSPGQDTDPSVNDDIPF